MARLGLGLSSSLRPWLSGICCGALLACGATESSPSVVTVDPSAGSAGVTGGLGGASSNVGGGGGGGLLLGGTAGLNAESLGGELSLGGAEDPAAFQGPVDLCLYDEQIPDNWAAAGAPDSGGARCAVGVLGRFAFNHCRYELLETMPFNVDPFLGGHSHCCYRSKLVGCP